MGASDCTAREREGETERDEGDDRALTSGLPQAGPVAVPGGRGGQRGVAGHGQGARAQHGGVRPGPQQPVRLQGAELQELHVQPLQPRGHLPHATCTR